MVEQMGVPAEATMKCILFDVEGRTVAVLVPGDREVGEEKLARLHFPERVRRFEDEDFARHGFAKGFVGPQGLGSDVTIFADPSVRGRANWVTGANRTGRARHRREPRSRLPRRSLGGPRPDPRWRPLPGRRRTSCEIGRSIVVGHIYQLGTYYSEPLEATYQAEDGSQRHYVMGSYGIGISRIMAAVVEQHHDDAGMIWPRHLAPFEVAVIMANADAPAVTEQAERIYGELRSARDRGRSSTTGRSVPA